MGIAVDLRSAVCLLGRFPALAGVDLRVSAGEIVLVKGANGAGKTTLLRALAGLVPVVKGEAVVLGHDLRRHRRRSTTHVGLLGHGPGLYDDLSVAENLRFWARAAGVDAAAVTPAMARVALDHRLGDQPAGRLSTGQRRRAALAALVVRRPRLWLLDEPHAGLDAAGRDLVDELVREAVAGGATAVLASHEVERATSLADRSVVLAGGRIVAEGAGVTGPRQAVTVAGEPAHVA
ncbi:MAG: heme ABC exporter ATP-binding protein CcmA [Actinobacteria bacterium]|nr:heme ABC exporter ATP-binding protein CcmA [Actinomycetota bacterium]